MVWGPGDFRSIDASDTRRTLRVVGDFISAIGSGIIGLVGGAFEVIGGSLRGMFGSANAALPGGLLALVVFVCLVVAAWSLAKR